MNQLEINGRLPDTPGVQALLEVLREANVPISVGRVCGSRIAAVWLSDDLNVHSVTLEPFELNDAALVRSRALEFLKALQRS
jgi:hypothetical protein